jgi:hypothetical protein
MNASNAVRHATGKSREWGKKGRKAEAKTFRAAARRQAINESRKG